MNSLQVAMLGSPAAALRKVKDGEDEEKKSISNDTEVDPPFSVTPELKFQFAARSKDSIETNMLGMLVQKTTGIRMRKGPGKLYTVEFEPLRLVLNMFRFAQRARDKYNTTVSTHGGESVTLDQAIKVYRRKPYVELVSSLGERLRPEEVQTIPGLDDLVQAIEDLSTPQIDAARENIKSGSVSFADLTEVYYPGAKVVSNGAAGSALDTGFEVVWSKIEQGRTLLGASKAKQ